MSNLAPAHSKLLRNFISDRIFHYWYELSHYLKTQLDFLGKISVRIAITFVNKKVWTRRVHDREEIFFTEFNLWNYKVSSDETDSA